MATNPFDQFDAPSGERNPFDQFDAPSMAPKPKPGPIRALADTAVAGGRGIASGVKMVADAAGADNAISRLAGQAAESIGGLSSDYAKAQQAAGAQRMKDAEATGSTWEELKAGVRNFADRPIDAVVEGLGSSLPTIAAVALTRGKVNPLAASTAAGAVQGAGSVKGQIFDDVQNRSIAAGDTPAIAASKAGEAQQYGGKNTDQIALGAGLGGLAGSTGVEAGLSRILAGSGKTGLVKSIAGGVAKEAPVEFAQGGQERLASNVASQREGFDVPTWQGVVGQGTAEGLAGAGSGGLVGAVEGAGVRRKPAPSATPLDSQAATPEAPAGPLTAAANLVTRTQEGAGTALSGTRKIIADAATRQGVDPQLALMISSMETGGKFNADAANPKSSARGLFQFMEATRKEFPEVTPEQWQDPQVQAQYGVAFIKKTNATMERLLGAPPTPAQAYMGHLLGAYGAASVLKADPNLPVEQVIAGYDPKRAADIVRLNGMSGLTAGQAAEKWAAKAEQATGQLGQEIKAIPFTDAKVAQKRADAQTASTGTPYEVVDHPNAPGRFAVLPVAAKEEKSTAAKNNDIPRADEAPLTAAGLSGAELLTRQMSDANPLLDRMRARDERSAAFNLIQDQAEQQRQAELTQIPEIAAEQNTVQSAVERAGTLQTPTAMQLALERAKTPAAPIVEEAPLVPLEPPAAPEPRIVERSPELVAMPRKLAEQRAAATGGEAVRIQNKSGKFAYTVLESANDTPQSQPSAPVETTATQTPATAGTAAGEPPATGTPAGAGDVEAVGVAQPENAQTAQLDAGKDPSDADKPASVSQNPDLDAQNAAAHAAATSPLNDLPQPTEAQREAGNYRKGHLNYEGLDLSIENPVGSSRSGVDPDGKPWQVDMTAHYGYLKRSTGGDGEQVDVYLADKPAPAAPVFVVDQYAPDGKFDEHKAVLGVTTQAEAEAVYDAHFSDGSGPARRQGVTQMSVEGFKAWARSDAAKQPVAQVQPAQTTTEAPAKPGLQKMRQAKATKEAPAAPQPPGAIVSTDIGKFKQGRSEANANDLVKELSKKNPGIDYRVEADTSLKNGFKVVGRERVAAAGETPAVPAGLAKMQAARKQDVAQRQLSRKVITPEGDAKPETAAFSRNDLPAKRTQAVKAIDEQVKAIASKWKNGPPVVVAYDMDDPSIPEIVRQNDLKQRSGGDVGAAEGFHYQGKVYLLANQLRTQQDAARVLFHEALGHYGLRGVFGDSLKPILQQIAAARKGQLNAKISEYGLDAANPRHRLIAAEELLAEMAQKTPEIGFVKRAIAAIRSWLRANVPGFNGLKLTNDEIIRSYILPARDFVERGKTVPPAARDAGGVPAFSRSADADFLAPDEDVTVQPPSSASWNAPEPSKFDDMVYKLQDKQVDTKRVVDAIKASGKQLSDEADVYLQEELYHGRTAKRTEDFVSRELQPLVAQMQARGLSLAEFDKYLHARHAKEANELIAERNPAIQDAGSGMTTATAETYLERLDPGKRTALEAAAAKVDAIIADTRKLYVDYGLESKETVDGWAQMFKAYVPLMREDHDGGMGIGQGFSIKGRESKGRTGSASAKVIDILANVALQRERAIVRGEKNKVATALIGLAETNVNPDFWSVGKAPKLQTYNADKGVVESHADPLFKSRDNVVVAKVLGKDGNVEERAVIFNEGNDRALRMAQALKNLDAGQLEGLLGVSAKITRYFAAVNTQFNPVFGVVNLTRDVQGALVNLSSTPLADKKIEVAKHTMSALRGIYADARAVRDGKSPKSEWAAIWEDFQDHGGQTGYRELFRTSADRAQAIEKALTPNKWMQDKLGRIFTADGKLKVPFAVAQKQWGAVFDWLSDYNLSMENAVRLSAYKVALEQGMSKPRAASLAKNLTVNFNRKGQIGQQAGAVYAFFNAAVQGSARMGQALFDMEAGKPGTIRLSKKGKKIVAGGILLGVVQALALSSAGYDDEEPPDFVRERNLVIPTGDGKYIAIPMPLGLHVLPNLGRIPTEFILGGGKKPAQHVVKLLSVFADAFNPIGSAGLSIQTIAPTALDPFVALSENRDWTGKPIAKTAFDKTKPGHMLAKDTASYPAKLLSEAINQLSGGTDYTAGTFSPTPDQIDYLFGQVTGGVGREASKALQTESALRTGEDLPPHKIPLLGRFYGDTATSSAQANLFYSNVHRIAEHEAEIKGRRKDGRSDEIAAYVADNPEARLMMGANYAERQVQKLRTHKRDLLARGAEREDVKRIEDAIANRMRSFNELVKRSQP